MEKIVKRIAIPVANGELCLHFGHCEKFFIADVNMESGEILDSSLEVPPAHEPGVLPKWISEKNVNVIIAGGMGSRARGLFNGYGCDVVVGAGVESPEVTIEKFVKGTLETGVNTCDH